jgi:hypothetical protein
VATVIDKRFQVFVSSTYKDLIDAREQVTEQLLRSRCIPSGMELFTASGRPPWDVIKAAIDTTDYMILILAGRYGSVGKDGRSFTEHEYDYAEELGIPVLAFLHEAPDMLPARHVDTGAAAKKLDAFRRKVGDSERHTVQFWSDARDLAQKVGTAIPEAIRTEPRPGWVRGGTETDQEGDRQAPVALWASSTSDELRQALSAPGGVARLEGFTSDAARAVTSIPFIQGQAEFNNVADLQEEYGRRVATLEEVARPLVRSIAAAARWGTPELDSQWLDLITELSTRPRVGGYAALIDLIRAPALLIFTAGGLGACAGRRDDLLGLLLSGQLEVDHPTREGEAPAVAILDAPLMYPTAGWPSRKLREYFEQTLSGDDAWRDLVFDRAWERWMYLVGVTRTYYRTVGQALSGVVESDWPYLRIEDGPERTQRTTAGKTIRRQVKNAGDGHPLLSKGLCEGSAAVFEGCAKQFDREYGEWGNRLDWEGLTGGRSTLPSGSHHPGSRDEV